MSTATTGRPRDPEVDRRILTAAIQLFGEVGWAGFSMEAVARRAGVGKASLYLRWPNRQRLLADAIRARYAWISDVDTGTVHADLLQLARQLLALYLGSTGRAALRLDFEARDIPGLAELYDQIQLGSTLAVRAIARRAIARGQLPDDASVTLIMDTLTGAVIAHALATPEQLREQVLAGADGYAERLVDFILTAALSTARTSPS